MNALANRALARDVIHNVAAMLEIFFSHCAGRFNGNNIRQMAYFHLFSNVISIKTSRVA
jgi:hypothetical protein